MIFDETYTLANGIKIPKLGLGTWFGSLTPLSSKNTL